MDPAATILRLAEIIARYEGTFQANTATIAQKDQTIASLQNELRECREAAVETEVTDGPSR